MSIHRSAALLIVYFAASLSLSAQPSPSPSSAPDRSKEAFVYEEFSRKVTFQTDGTSFLQDSARIRIQSDAGVQKFGLLTFSYASGEGSFDIDYIRVKKADGSVIATPPETIQDMPAEITRQAPFYSDLHEKHVAVKGLSVGDLLEYQTREQVTRPLAPGQFWLQYDFSRDMIISKEVLEVTVPRDRTIKLKTSGSQPLVTETATHRVYTWTRSNLQRKEKNAKQEAARTVWEQTRGRMSTPDVLLSSFQSWEELGRWYTDLEKPQLQPSPAIRAKAAELTRNATDDLAKIQAIYHYVSTQIRYIGVGFGIGRYQSHPASDVIDNQFGDCKDKHTLLASLLSSVGIKAYPALISSQHDIDADVPSPIQVNHVITVIPRGADLIWLDSTAEVGPFRYLVSPLRGKHALVVYDNDSSSLVLTPGNPPYPSIQNFQMDARLDPSGTLQGNAELSLRGDVEVLVRAAYRSVPLPQWKELTQRISMSLGFAGDVSEVNASSPENTDEPFRLTYKYTRKDFGDWPNRRILAPSPAFTIPAPPDESALPTVPMILDEPGEYVAHSRLELPPSYAPQLPSAVHLKRDYAEYNATYSFKNGALISDRQLRILSPELPKSSYIEYSGFYKSVTDDRDVFIPLSSGPPSPIDQVVAATASIQKSMRALPDSSDPEALRLEAQAVEAVAKHDSQSAISALYRAVSVDPKFSRAWIMLGSLLSSAKQSDAADEAFRKAIAVDPSQPFPYKAYGYTLMASSQFAPAVSIWQTYTNQFPDDLDGPANLASALAKLKRYSEAASAYEAALKLRPDRQNLQSGLALAYMRAGEDDKAASALNKLAEMDPTPMSLNFLAYEMAVAKKQLPLALQFAEKAVRGEVEDSAKVDLATLKLEDLRHPLSLAAYWDTLGWVYASMSRLDEAEKNLNAAWRISQEGVMAAHLCEVYDREHKTQAAIRMCRVALARLPSSSSSESAEAMEQTRVRLQRLGPGSTNHSVTSAIDEIVQMRTFKLPRIVAGNATAEFFVLLTSNPATQRFEVTDFKFVSGSDRLKNAGKPLRSINFNFPSPDAGTARLVRRGVLGCYQYSGCEFVLLDFDSVHSLN